MHSSVLIFCHLVVWRIAQIHNKKDLSFWAVATKTGSALVASTCFMFAKNFYAKQIKQSEKQCTGPFRRGVLSHVHIPIHKKSFKSVINCMCKLFSTQTAVVDY